MKTVLFVPGSGEDLQSRNYQAVLKAIESRGYKTQFVPITWQRRTVNNWLEELMAVYETHDPQQTILCGFSWGSIITFLAAATRTPNQLWLCSLSPYFSDDAEVQTALKKGAPKYLGKRRLHAFARLNFSRLAQGIACPTTIFMGEHEAERFPDLRRRCEIAVREIPNAKLVMVPGAGHEIDHPNYVDAIKENI